MFLLILILTTSFTFVSSFTFHNVSINSICLQKESEQYLDLHSTMFLLILGSTDDKKPLEIIYIPQCFY